MPSAKEFRALAQECLDWAKAAKSEQERAAFMQMADTWIEAATRLEVDTDKLTEKVPLVVDDAPPSADSADHDPGAATIPSRS
jgi:hypothetical protein